MKHVFLEVWNYVSSLCSELHKSLLTSLSEIVHLYNWNRYETKLVSNIPFFSNTNCTCIHYDQGIFCKRKHQPYLINQYSFLGLILLLHKKVSNFTNTESSCQRFYLFNHSKGKKRKEQRYSLYSLLNAKLEKFCFYLSFLELQFNFDLNGQTETI